MLRGVWFVVSLAWGLVRIQLRLGLPPAMAEKRESRAVRSFLTRPSSNRARSFGRGGARSVDDYLQALRPAFLWGALIPIEGDQIQICRLHAKLSEHVRNLPAMVTPMIHDVQNHLPERSFILHAR